MSPCYTVSHVRQQTSRTLLPTKADHSPFEFVDQIGWQYAIAILIRFCRSSKSILSLCHQIDRAARDPAWSFKHKWGGKPRRTYGTFCRQQQILECKRRSGGKTGEYDPWKWYCHDDSWLKSTICFALRVSLYSGNYLILVKIPFFGNRFTHIKDRRNMCQKGIVIWIWFSTRVFWQIILIVHSELANNCKVQLK